MVNFVTANEITAWRLPVHNPEVPISNESYRRNTSGKKYLQVSKEVSRYFCEYLDTFVST